MIYRELIIIRVKLHKYLGMTLNLRTPGELWVTMVDYLKGMLEYFSLVIKGRSMIPEANYLFQVRYEDKLTLLDKEWTTSFHHTVARLLFVTPRSRKDIKVDIAFLCTQVRIPDKDYQGTLVRVLRYIMTSVPECRGPGPPAQQGPLHGPWVFAGCTPGEDKMIPGGTETMAGGATGGAIEG